MAKIVTSRSAFGFMERAGIIIADAVPRSRIDLGALKVMKIPLVPPQPTPAFMREELEGECPPDNAGIAPWPDGVRGSS